MTLYVNDPKYDGMGVDAKRPASLRERLIGRGWVECLRCEDMEGCDHCLDGLTPPGEMVDAAAKRAYSGHRLPIDEEWDSELMPVEVIDLWLTLIRNALLAAARWEREQ